MIFLKGRKIRDFPNYTVTRTGDVYNSKGQKLKPLLSGKGYARVSLSNESVKHKRMSVHRLVADAFIENPDKLPQVNHLDENKFNNSVGNLEWSTPLDNLNHSHVIEKASAAKYHKVRCKTTGKVYGSIKEACDELGLHHSNLVACCNNRRRRCGGLEWEYE